MLPRCQRPTLKSHSHHQPNLQTPSYSLNPSPGRPPMGDPLKDHMFAGHAVAAAGAVALSSFLTHPLDTLKSLLQVGANSKQKLGVSQVLGRVHSASGPAGLYSGLGWSTLGKISGLGARFGLNEILTAYYKDGREDNYVYVSEALLAGMAAGVLESVVCSPFELLKLRKQIASANTTTVSVNPMKDSSQVLSKLLPGYIPDIKAWNHTIALLSPLSSTNTSNMVGALKQYPWMLTGSGRPPFASEVKKPLEIISLEGWSALWRGLRSGIVRDCIFGGIFFSSWQFFHIAILNWKALDVHPPPRTIDEVGPVSPLTASLVAGFSGVVAAAASHPFDTAKCRSQCIVIPKYISRERKLMRWEAPGVWIERVTGTSPVDRNILFRGIGFRMARCGLGSFALVGSYLLAVDYLF